MPNPKNLSVLYAGEKQELDSLFFADSLAEEFSLNAKCLTLCPEADVPSISNYLGEGTMGLYAKYLESVQRDIKLAQNKIKESFDKHNFSKLKFSSEIGNPKEIVAYWGKFTDIIMCYKDIDRFSIDFENVVATALFETSRPVILMPENQVYSGMERIIIAWDGSFRASGAVKTAIPFLEKAKEIVILTIDESQKDMSSVKDLLDYLATYNITAIHKNIAKVHRCVGDEILSEAEKRNANLIVMGAYTHSKMRQIVLGGATKFILANANIPVMLKH
ncbi:MAG: universal stress protein [Rickettsiales bacterium]|nr:universal stress protein [Rickettsiales bacterium]